MFPVYRLQTPLSTLGCWWPSPPAPPTPTHRSPHQEKGPRLKGQSGAAGSCWFRQADLRKAGLPRPGGGQLLLAFRCENHSVQPQFQLTATSSAEDSPSRGSQSSRQDHLTGVRSTREGKTARLPAGGGRPFTHCPIQDANQQTDADRGGGEQSCTGLKGIRQEQNRPEALSLRKLCS